MRVLITGVAGFVGRHLAAQLLAKAVMRSGGWPARIMRSRGSILASGLIGADLRQRELVDRALADRPGRMRSSILPASRQLRSHWPIRCHCC